MGSLRKLRALYFQIVLRENFRAQTILQLQIHHAHDGSKTVNLVPCFLHKAVLLYGFNSFKGQGREDT